MSEEKSFWKAIRENPGDVTLKLGFADRLEGRGDKRASLLRLAVSGDYRKWGKDVQVDLRNPEALCLYLPAETFLKNAEEITGKYQVGAVWLTDFPSTGEAKADLDFLTKLANCPSL